MRRIQGRATATDGPRNHLGPLWFSLQIFAGREPDMAQQSARQRRTTGRVMHEYKHGELKRSQAGKGGKVKSRKQAIAIALKESGAYKYESKRGNVRNERKT